MRQALVIWAAVIIAYIFFRMHGGHGLTIRYKLPDPSTPAGKRDKLMSYLVLLLLAGATIYAIVGGSNIVGISSWLLFLAVFSLFFQANRLRIRRKRK